MFFFKSAKNDKGQSIIMVKFIQHLHYKITFFWRKKIKANIITTIFKYIWDCELWVK